MSLLTKVQQNLKMDYLIRRLGSEYPDISIIQEIYRWINIPFNLQKQTLGQQISREMVSKSKKEVSEGDNKYRPLALVLAVLYRCYMTWRSWPEIEEVLWSYFINVEVERRVSKNSMNVD